MKVHSQYMKSIPKLQPSLETIQASPVSGTRYTLLTEVNVRILSLLLRSTWTVQNNPIEIHFTIDGVPVTHSQANPISNTWYEPAYDGTLGDLLQPMTTTQFRPYGNILYEGQTVKIEMETTGGTVSDLRAVIKYAKW